MNDEILKLANELKITCVKGDREEILTTFYRAAYNKAIEDVLRKASDSTRKLDEMGYIVMSAPAKHDAPEYAAPLSYGRGTEVAHDQLLRRGRATIFRTARDAMDAMTATINKAKADGDPWPKKFQYLFIEAEYAPSNAKVTGSPDLSASPCGLPGYALLGEQDNGRTTRSDMG